MRTYCDPNKTGDRPILPTRGLLQLRVLDLRHLEDHATLSSEFPPDAFHGSPLSCRSPMFRPIPYHVSICQVFFHYDHFASSVLCFFSPIHVPFWLMWDMHA